MPAPLPAVEAAVAELGVAAAVDGLALVHDARLQGRERHHHLEGRAGRVGALDGLGGERAVVVARQPPVIRDRDAAHEQVRVEGRRRGDREQVARADVHHDGRRALLAHPHLREVLQARVHGELEVGAGRGRPVAQLAHDAAPGVDLDLPGAGRAPQLPLAPGLHAVLADLEARDLEERVGVGELRQVVVRHRPDIAHDVGEVLLERVLARQAHLGRDARKRGGVDRDAGDLLPGEAVGDGDGHEGVAALQFAARALQIRGRHLHEALEAGQRLVEVARVLAHDHHAVVLPVAGHQPTVPIEDRAARGRQQPGVDAVLLGEQAVLVGLLDLQAVHARAEHPGHAELERAQHQRAPAHAARRECGVARGPPHAGLPLATPSRAEARGRRAPSTAWTTSAAAG